MLKVLIKNRLQAMLGSLVGASRSKKKRGTGVMIGFALLMVYVLGVFAWMFGMFFSALAQPFHSAGLDWLYFAFAGLMALALMIVGSIFMTKSQLYEARDNELLLSLPVPPSAILASRMVVLLLFNAVFGLMVVAPAGVVWLTQVSASVGQILIFLLIFLAMPFLSLAVSSVFGWLLALISTRVRNKSLFSTLFSLLFLGVYFYFYSQAYTYIQYLAVHGQQVAEKLGAVAPLVWLGRAVAEGNALLMLPVLLVELVPFVLVTLLLSATFIKVATANRGFAHVRYREKTLRTSSADTALLSRELKRFVSCPGYMMNAGIGLIFVAALGVFALIKPDLFEMLGQQMAGGDATLLPLLAAAAVCLMNSMVMISAPSISLEGSRLWIVQSIPVRPQQVLKAKLNTHFFVSLPFMVFTSAALAFVLKADALSAVLLIVLPLVYCLWCAIMGLVLNLYFPRFDWINEIQPIKQGISTMLAMLVGFVSVLVPILVYAFALAGKVTGGQYLLLCTAVFAVGDALMLRWLNTRGARLLTQLCA